MPRGRDFTSLATQAAGANDERKLGGISIDGASGAENRIIIDGVETTDTWSARPASSWSRTSCEELQIKSSGYSAEYGGSTGGVLNAHHEERQQRVARRGARLLVGGRARRRPRGRRCSSRRPTRAAPNTSRIPRTRYKQVEPGFTLGGPLVRDRLWVFAGYVPSFRPLDRTVTFRPTARRARFDRTSTGTTRPPT